ncbi:MAG: hypothetical protein M1834_006919 [Cirrosporium novae-zelandiae]|nr:MAG: hypothetical protein M1834_006919 [Cirrosporium novae-zelandiae]
MAPATNITGKDLSPASHIKSKPRQSYMRPENQHFNTIRPKQLPLFLPYSLDSHQLPTLPKQLYTETRIEILLDYYSSRNLGMCGLLLASSMPRPDKFFGPISSSLIPDPSPLALTSIVTGINAFDYMLLARLINIFIYNKKCLGIPARRLSMIFILSDVASFLVQAAGACMLSSTDENSIKLGTHILMGGLGLQLVSMTVFTFVSLRFYKSVKSSDPGSTTRWRTLLFLLWLSLILITIRIIYRFLEFSKGIYSVYEAKEGYFYGLEALPMLFAVMEFNFYHPGRVMPGGLGEFEKKEKKKGRKGKKGEKNLDLDVESGISGDDGLLEGGQGRDQGRGDGI